MEKPGQSVAWQYKEEKVNSLNKPYHWIQSFVTDDKIHCIHVAENEEMVREHAKRGKFPINTGAEVKAVIDPATGTPETSRKGCETCINV